MHEVFEHTADIGLRVRAATLNELFAEAAVGLFSVIVANLDAVRPVQEITFQIEGSQLDDLLFDWLAELLFTLDTRRLLFSRFEVEVRPDGLRAVAHGEPIDRARHELDMEVKAITYHGLKVEPVSDGYQAEVIVDI